MSMIECLSISGIRSFGPDKSDKQTITFKPPLTLILGANGCGKTTIIECLKYGLTGDFPPGSNKGRSFVHDPKIYKSIESLGQAKLRVRTIKGHHLTVSRSMKSISKNNQLTFSTMSSSLDIEIDGKKEQLTHRCFDVNAEMCQAMGVSKAILNNVIFCHQEDSNWPLDESKKLKEKFDAIFGTTEYNKAIDKIIKLRKIYLSNQNEKESDLKILQHLKKETETKQLDLDATTLKLQNLNDQIEVSETKLIPIRKRLATIQKIEYNLGTLQSKEVELATQIKNNKEQQQKLKKNIKSMYSGSLNMLESDIRSFKNDMEIKNGELNSLNQDLNMVKIQEKRINSCLLELEKERTTLSYKRQQEQEFNSERSCKIIDLCNNLGLNSEFNTESENFDGILNEIKNGIQNEEGNFRKMTKENDEIESCFQQAIDQVKEEKISIESQIKSKKQQILDLHKEQNNVEKEIASVEKNALKLKQMSHEIQKYDQKLEAFSSSINLEEMKSSIITKKQKRDELQDNLDKLDTKLTELNKISKLMSEIDLKENQLNIRKKESQRLRNKHSESFKLLLKGKNVDKNYKKEMELVYQNLQREINDLNKRINSNQRTSTELKIRRTNKRDDLKKHEKELTESDEKIYDLCSSLPFETVLKKQKEKMEKTQLDYGALKSASVLYKRYITLIDADPCCPLCHKDMNSNEISSLSSELQEEIQRLPTKIQETEIVLKSDQLLYENLLKLQPVNDKLELLKASLVEHKKDLKNIEEKLRTAETEHENLQMKITEPTANVQIVNSLIGDMSVLDEAIKDVAFYETELNKLKVNLPTNSFTQNGGTIDDAQLEKSVVSAELRAERSEIEKIEKKYESSVNQINDIREKRSRVKEQQIALQEGVQALSQLKTRVTDIIKQIEEQTNVKSNLELKLIPLRDKLAIEMEKKDKKRNENRKNLEKFQQKLNDINNLNLNIQKLNQQIHELSEMHIQESIENVKVSMKKYEKEQIEKTKQNENISQKIELLKQEISSQAINERDLLDNKDLKKLEFTEIDLQEKYEELKKDIGEADYKLLTKEKSELIKQNDLIIREKSRFSGQVNELDNQVASLQKMLAKAEYKNSIRNYRQALNEVEAIKAVLHDLNEYRLALEWALIKFHSEKMNKINQLIREYWRSIYRGNDIDFIEIKTDETGTENEKRRNYNYRVVQSKNDIELDMRGRCSAGQRVLACLIIRIALAETFSGNCGVLALDEPTTNLDRSNIISLCDVLKRVIEERQSQSNFMLIIITHDEEFLNTLDHVNSYYKLYRGNSGKSIIEQINQN